LRITSGTSGGGWRCRDQILFLAVKREINDSAIRAFEAGLRPARGKLIWNLQASCGSAQSAPAKNMPSRFAWLRRARWYALRAASFPARFSVLVRKGEAGKSFIRRFMSNG